MNIKKPEIKSWDCVDHDPIEEWVPEDPSNVDYWCNISIGIEGEEGADNFQVHVVSENMLSQISSKQHIIVVPYYEGWNQVLKAVKLKLDKCSDIEWSGMSLQIAKLFYWEYEGYNEKI
jgi:hypothetical protein